MSQNFILTIIDAFGGSSMKHFKNNGPIDELVYKMLIAYGSVDNTSRDLSYSIAHHITALSSEDQSIRKNMYLEPLRRSDTTNPRETMRRYGWEWYTDESEREYLGRARASKQKQWLEISMMEMNKLTTSEKPPQTLVIYSSCGFNH